VDLHGYHPNTVLGEELVESLVRQAWEMGKPALRLIHGLGSSSQFANTNTGYLGLTVRSCLRNDPDLRQWMYAKIDVSRSGATTVRLRSNPSPTRTDLDSLPDLDF
jgi:Smr domain